MDNYIDKIMVNKVIVQELGKNKQIMVTIPKSVASAMGLKKGDKVGWAIASATSLVLSKER